MEKNGVKTMAVLVSVLALLISGVFVSLPVRGADESSEKTIIKGVVLDSDQLPLSDVTVKLTDLNNGEVFTTTTAEDSGYFEFVLEDIGAHVGSGYYKLQATKDGYTDEGQATQYISDLMPGDVVTFNNVDSPALQLVRLPERWDVSGKIMDEEGHGISSADIEFKSVMNGGTVTVSVKSNVTGRYSTTLYGYEGTTYSVLVTAEGYEPYYASEFNTSEADITLVKADKSGKWVIKGPISADIHVDTIALLEKVGGDLKLVSTSEDQELYYKIQAYPGNFILVAIPEAGYAPYINYNVVVDQEYPEALPLTFETTDEPGMQTTLMFSKDLKTIDASYQWKMAPVESLTGYGCDMLGVRAQLDLLGDMDGTIGAEEMAAFNTWIKDRIGLYHMSTEGFVEVNGTYYLYDEGSFEITSISGLNGTAVNSTELITVNAHWTYTVKDEDKQVGDHFDVVVDDVRSGETVTLKFPTSGEDDWEIVNATVDTETGKWINSGQVDVTGNCDFMLRTKEMPEVNTILLKYSEAGNELTKLSDGKTYIVKNGTEVKLYGDVYDSVDHPEGGDDTMNYTWLIKSGNSTVTLYENNAVYNFTDAGEYNITLKASDSSNLVNETSVILYVDNAAPVLSESLLIIDPADKTINEGDVLEDAGVLKINASKVTDPIVQGGEAKGEIQSYVWEYDGKTATGREVELRWNEPGTYEVNLTVTDMAGNKAKLTITGIKVLDKTAPEVKVKLNGNPITLGVDQHVEVGNVSTFDASESADYKNGEKYNVTSFAWKVFVEGSEDTVLKSGNGATFSYDFPTADETYIVSLTVADDSGNSITKNITVKTKSAAFKIDIDISKDKPTENDEVTITVTVNNTGDATAKDITVTLTIDYGDSKDKKTKTIPELAPGKSEELKFKVKVKYSDKGATITAKAESPTASEEGSQKSVHIDVKKAEWPTWYYVVIFIVIIVVGIGALYGYKRYSEQKLLEQRRQRKKGKSDEEE